MRLNEWSHEVCFVTLQSGIYIHLFPLGMNIRWDYFVNQYDTARYVSTSEAARDNRHIQFVREFASVVSILQVWLRYSKIYGIFVPYFELF